MADWILAISFGPHFQNLVKNQEFSVISNPGLSINFLFRIVLMQFLSDKA